MPEPATINDKRTLDGPGEEMRAARDLRQARRGGTSEEDSSLDNLISLAGGVGGMGTDSRRRPDGSGRDNLGRPVRPERPLPAGRQSRQGEGGGLGSGRAGQGAPGAEPAFAGGQPTGAGGDLDSRLMAARLREEKNKEREKKEKEGEGEKGEEAEKSPEGEEDKEGKGGLGDRISRLKEQANLKKRAQKKIEEKITAPAKKGTNRLLKNAWIHLIDSFGATLLYIDLHVFLQNVLGDKLFCKLGEEWIPKQIQGAGGGAGKAAGKKFGLAESAGCCLLNFLALIIILVIIALILLIADIIENPLSYIGEALGIVWDATTGLFSGK